MRSLSACEYVKPENLERSSRAAKLMEGRLRRTILDMAALALAGHSEAEVNQSMIGNGVRGSGKGRGENNDAISEPGELGQLLESLLHRFRFRNSSPVSLKNSESVQEKNDGSLFSCQCQLVLLQDLLQFVFASQFVPEDVLGMALHSIRECVEGLLTSLSNTTSRLLRHEHALQSSISCCNCGGLHRFLLLAQSTFISTLSLLTSY